MTKEDIKRNTDVRDILREFGIEVHGSRCRGWCCGRDDLCARVGKSSYYCYVCSKSFDVFDVVMALRNCSWNDAFDFLGGSRELTAEERKRQAEYELQKQRSAKEKENDRLEYLRLRKEYFKWKDIREKMSANQEGYDAACRFETNAKLKFDEFTERVIDKNGHSNIK